jgi:hypothetical protein
VDWVDTHDLRHGDTSGGRAFTVEQPVHGGTSFVSLTTRLFDPATNDAIGNATKLIINVQEWRNSNSQLPAFGERISKEDWDTIPDVILEAQQHILSHTQKE